MRDMLEMLTKLQAIDHKVDQLANGKVELPGQIETLKKQVQDLEALIAEGEANRIQREKEKRQEELELQGAQDELKKYQEQLYRIKTNREYDAIQAEIDAQKQKISQHEENILNLMTISEELAETLQERQQELETLKAQNVPKWEQLEQQLSSIEDMMAVENDHRKNIVIRMDKAVLNTYERIRRGKNGLAIVAIRKRACGGCFKTLPLQKIQEVRSTERLITCENCGRILYWDEEAQN